MMPERTPGDALVAAVGAVAWDSNVKSFAAAAKFKDQIADAAYRLAQWARQLETADEGNPALAFIREMQLQTQYAAALVTLALYKPAAGSMRAMFESAMYYTYFRSHFVELETLVRDPNYFIDKRAIIQFHKMHTPNFDSKQAVLGLNSQIDKWYSETSAVIHGQIPGKWVSSRRIEDIAFKEAFCSEAVASFEVARDLIHGLLLCTVDIGRWYKFTKPAKAEFLKGLTPDKKRVLALPPT